MGFKARRRSVYFLKAKEEQGQEQDYGKREKVLQLGFGGLWKAIKKQKEKKDLAPAGFT